MCSRLLISRTVSLAGGDPQNCPEFGGSGGLPQLLEPVEDHIERQLELASWCRSPRGRIAAGDVRHGSEKRVAAAVGEA